MTQTSRPARQPIARRAAARVAVGVLLAVLATAVGADILASDAPLVARVRGHLYVLPGWTNPSALGGENVRTLGTRLGPEDWLVSTPVGWGPNEQDKGYAAFAAPSARHWLGTDAVRRDVLARLVHGSRVSLLVGLLSVALHVSIGTALGLLAAFFGGWVDVIISRLTEAVLTLPVFFLILAVMGVVEGAGLGALIVVLGLVLWTRTARLVRAEALRLRHTEFVLAAESLGFSSWRIMMRHILPNAAAPIFVAATFGIAGAIVAEAALSFLGFGAPDDWASWGGLLRGAMGNFHAWWLVLFPGAAIFATVTAVNTLGEILRERLDPQAAATVSATANVHSDGDHNLGARGRGAVA